MTKMVLLDKAPICDFIIHYIKFYFTASYLYYWSIGFTKNTHVINCKCQEVNADGTLKIMPVYHCTYNQDQWGKTCRLLLFLFESAKV